MPCNQVIRKSWPSGPTPYLLRRLGDAEPNTVARSEVRLRERLRRKEGRELLTFLRLARAGRICTNSPGIAPSDKIPFPSPLAPTSSKKPRSNRLGKCSQNHPACLTCHPERSNSSRCALNLSPSLSLSLSILHRLALFRNGIGGIESSWVPWVCSFCGIRVAEYGVEWCEWAGVHELYVNWILDNVFFFVILWFCKEFSVGALVRMFVDYFLRKLWGRGLLCSSWGSWCPADVAK